MQKQQLTWNTETPFEIEIRRTKRTVPYLLLAQARGQHRKPRFAFPTAFPGKPCPTRRSYLAALRNAEMQAWQASGGDSLHSA